MSTISKQSLSAQDESALNKRDVISLFFMLRNFISIFLVVDLVIFTSYCLKAYILGGNIVPEKSELHFGYFCILTILVSIAIEMVLRYQDEDGNGGRQNIWEYFPSFCFIIFTVCGAVALLFMRNFHWKTASYFAIVSIASWLAVAIPTYIETKKVILSRQGAK